MKKRMTKKKQRRRRRKREINPHSHVREIKVYVALVGVQINKQIVHVLVICLTFKYFIFLLHFISFCPSSN